MNLEVFCYVGRLTSPETLASAVKMLGAPDRERAEAVLAKLEGVSRDLLVARWASLREAEWNALAQRAEEQLGMIIHDLTPRGLQWLASAMADVNG